ncbi:MAG: SEC-C domain-containing protein [Actinomycetota bacterium]|nr:SEC-C domain-containing protein [Actinomycetota bacterium]
MHYPELHFQFGARTAEAVGPLTIDMPDGTLEAVTVRIEFSEGYPQRVPYAYDHESRWEPELDRHIENGGRFCLFLPGANEPDLRPEGRILDYIADLKSFLRQQLILDSQRRHDSSARFPGPEWPHGPQVAYGTFVAELLAKEPPEIRSVLWHAARRAGPRRTDPCPCGSGSSTESCHWRTSKKLRRAIYESPQLAQLTYQQLVQVVEKTPR